MRSILFAVLLLLVLPVCAQTQEQGPIIDMHLHANKISDLPDEEPLTGLRSPESTEELRKQTFDALRERNVVLAATSADPVTDSYKRPNAYATSVSHVFVNGVPALLDGELTGQAPGRFVKQRR
jgi:hypothetical protein